MSIYSPSRPAASHTLAVRGIPYHVLQWGSASAAPPLVLLHGWMDVGASWQFTVDALPAALADARTLLAPDWRGFGRSMPEEPCDAYHFVDYLADLDQLLDRLLPGTAIDLVGHSMGGNVAMMYAGARPARVRRLVNLEGFGLPAAQPADAPRQLGRWMDELAQGARGELALKTYASAAEVAGRLMKTNPRLPQDKAVWLAQHWASEQADGRWHIRGDAAHKVASALPYRVDEALALYAAITAPVLSVTASDDSLGQWWKGRYTRAEYQQRLTHVRDCRQAQVADAGHMLHHDQPQQVAQLVADFLG